MENITRPATRGTVTGMAKDRTGKFVSHILVKFDEIEEIQCIERKQKYIQVMPGYHVYRNMFPLMNTYAMTIHKSQSLSLACVFMWNIFAQIAKDVTRTAEL